MKLKFDANLIYQTEAVQAVVDVFDGQLLSQSSFEVSFTEQVGMIEQTFTIPAKSALLSQLNQ